MYAYLILYEKSKDIRYLKYAEQHVQIVEKLIDRDKRYDMLSGNAGAAYVLLKLYKHTGNSQYLYIAEQAIEILQKNSEKQQKGIGWRIVDDLPPMRQAMRWLQFCGKKPEKRNTKKWQKKYGNMKNHYMM